MKVKTLQDRERQPLTKEELLKRLKASRQRKKESVEMLKHILKVEYKKRTARHVRQGEDDR